MILKADIFSLEALGDLILELNAANSGGNSGVDPAAVTGAPPADPALDDAPRDDLPQGEVLVRLILDADAQDTLDDAPAYGHSDSGGYGETSAVHVRLGRHFLLDGELAERLAEIEGIENVALEPLRGRVQLKRVA